MIDVEDLRRLVRHEQRQLSEIERIFAALVLYPNGEDIHNSTRADRLGAFAEACTALVGDSSVAPQQLADFVVGELGGKVADKTYGGLAAAIDAEPDRFNARLNS